MNPTPTPTRELTCAERVGAMWETTKAALDLYMKDGDVYENGSDEEGIGPFHEYGLSFDYVVPHTFKGQEEGFWRYQMSWGGPSDEIRFYGDSSGGNGSLYKAEYWFMDWFDGAMRHVTGSTCIHWLWHQFCDMGAVQNEYEKAMADYEPPMDEEEEGEDE